jgi:hypothetical protein
MDERASVRVEVDRPIEFRIGERTVSALLYNLSMGGCMIEGPDDLARPGDQVSLRLGRLIDATGRVIWQQGRHCGIRFAAALHEAVVSHLGFKPSEVCVDIAWPVDRFGRVLPALRA